MVRFVDYTKSGDSVQSARKSELRKPLSELCIVGTVCIASTSDSRGDFKISSKSGDVFTSSTSGNTAKAQKLTKWLKFWKRGTNSTNESTRLPSPEGQTLKKAQGQTQRENGAKASTIDKTRRDARKENRLTRNILEKMEQLVTCMPNGEDPGKHEEYNQALEELGGYITRLIKACANKEQTDKLNVAFTGLKFMSVVAECDGLPVEKETVRWMSDLLDAVEAAYALESESSVD